MSVLIAWSGFAYSSAIAAAHDTSLTLTPPDRSMLLEDEGELISSSGHSVMDTRYWVNVDRIVAASRRKELEGSIRHAITRLGSQMAPSPGQSQQAEALMGRAYLGTGLVATRTLWSPVRNKRKRSCTAGVTWL